MKALFAIKALGVAGGGAERVFVNVVNALHDNGHDVTVLSYDRDDVAAFYPLNARINWIRLGIGAAHQPTTARETLNRMRALRNTVREQRPEVAVGFMHSMYIPLGLAMLGTGVPLLGSEHIVYSHYASRPLQKLLLHLTPWLTRRITVVSEQARLQFPRSLRSRMVVVPNAVDLKTGERADVRGVNATRKTLLCVGRLSAQKDHAVLIRAFALLATQHADWDLRIVGDGELREALQAQVNEAGMQHRIFITGATSDVNAEYAGAQLFVLPSLYESLGLVIIEALAQGLPCVGFADCPGVNQLIEHGTNGVLVDGGVDRDTQHRARALAAALGPLLADTATRERLAPRGIEAFAQYAPERVLQRWEQLLREVHAASR